MKGLLAKAFRAAISADQVWVGGKVINERKTILFQTKQDLSLHSGGCEQ